MSDLKAEELAAIREHVAAYQWVETDSPYLTLCAEERNTLLAAYDSLAERLKACEADAAEMRDLLQEAYDYGTLWRGNRIYKHIKSDAALSPSPKAEKEAANKAEKECARCNDERTIFTPGSVPALDRRIACPDCSPSATEK